MLHQTFQFSGPYSKIRPQNLEIDSFWSKEYLTVYNGKSFCLTNKTACGKLPSIALFTDNFFHLHYNVFERDVRQFRAILQFLPDDASHPLSNTLKCKRAKVTAKRDIGSLSGENGYVVKRSRVFSRVPFMKMGDG